MPKQKTHETKGEEKSKKLVISKTKLRKLEKEADRDQRIAQGYDPAFQGDGAHGGTVDAQKKRARKKSKKDLIKYRNQRTSNLED